MLGSNDAIIQNLKDAGCDNDTVMTFVKDIREGKTAEVLKLLSTHRRSLLGDLHRTQRQIDCLDYLVYQLEKQQKK